MIEPLKDGEIEKMTEEQKAERMKAIMEASIQNYGQEETSLADDIKDVLEQQFKDTHESTIDKALDYIMTLIESKYGEE
tara:strand:- start:34 stop:270 length:237 start_codon:yes stop_codon:yes gene_type:complete